MYSRYRLSSKHDKENFVTSYVPIDEIYVVFFSFFVSSVFALFWKSVFLYSQRLISLTSPHLFFCFCFFFQKVYFYNFYNAFIILNDAFIYSFFFSVSLVIFFMYKFILEFNLTSSTIASSFIWSITFLNYLDIQQNQKYLYWNKNFIFNVIYLTISVCKE